MPDAIIDAHHHIWRLSETPWLQGPPVPRIFGAYDAIRRDYAIADYLADAKPSGVVKSVFVQVNVAPGKEVRRGRLGAVGRRCQRLPARDHRVRRPRLALESRTRSTASLPAATCAPSASSCTGMRSRSTASRRKPDVMHDAAWRKGLDEVRRRGLMFELQVFASQMPDAVKLVRDYADVTFILLHAGMLEDRSEAGWALWRAGMKQLAACPNVVVKLSGLGTFDRACSAERWRPVIEATIDLFGPDRCMFGSNFPIEKLWTDYASLVATFRASLARFTPAEQRAVLHDTAARLYKLQGRLNGHRYEAKRGSP